MFSCKQEENVHQFSHIEKNYTPYASCGSIGGLLVSLAHACCKLCGLIGPMKAKGRTITTNPNGCDLLRKAQFKDETYTLDSENIQAILPPFKEEVSAKHLVHSHFEKRANYTRRSLSNEMKQHIDYIKLHHIDIVCGTESLLSEIIIDSTTTAKAKSVHVLIQNITVLEEKQLPKKSPLLAYWRRLFNSIDCVCASSVCV